MSVATRNERLIRDKYPRDGHPIGFGGINQIRWQYPFVKESQAANALTDIEAYTTFKETRRPKSRNPIFAYKCGELMQVKQLKDD